MAEEDDLDLSDWDDVDVIEAKKDDNTGNELATDNTSKSKSDEENWDDVITIEVLENYCGGLMKEMEAFRKEGILCDAIIAVDDKELPVHKNVISAISPFFKDIFSKLKDPNENKITLRNLNGNTMDDILHFAYTGEVCIHDGNVRQLLAASRFLKLQNLKDKAIIYLEKKLSPASAVDIMMLADKHKCQNLLQSAEKLITNNFVTVSRTIGFKKLTFEMLHLFVQSENIRVSKEEEVFEAIMSWVRSDTGKIQERLSQLPNLLREIRFPLMSLSYITEISMDSLIIENSECYEVINEGLSYHNLPEDSKQNSYDYHLTRPRKFMVSVWGVVAVGGWSNEKPSNDVFTFVDSKQEWFPLKALPTARYSHSVTACDGFVYVLGGRDENTKLLSSVIRFDPTANKWQDIKSLPYPVAALSVCVFEGQIFVVGGFSYKGSVDSVLRYNSRYNVWQKVGSLQSSRAACALVADENFMYAMGGVHKIGSAENSKWEYLETMEIYSRDTNSWTRGKDLLSKRAHCVAVYLNQKIYLTGGHNKMMSVNKGLDVYDTGKETWASVLYFGAPRAMSGIAAYDNKFYIVGGVSKDGDVLNTVETYDVTKNRNNKIAALPKSLSLLQCCALQIKLAALEGMSMALIE